MNTRHAVRFAAHRSRLQLIIGPLFAIVVGCHSPYTIIHQATGQAIRGDPVFAIAPIEFDDALVGDLTEENWLARRSPSQRASWEADKQALSRRFAARLIGRGERLRFETASASDSDSVVVRTRVEFVEPGFYALQHVQRDTSLRLDVQLLSHGVPFEEFLLRTHVTARLMHPSVSGRMRSAAEQLADRVYEYLLVRTGRS